MSNPRKLPQRSQVRVEDTWDLSSLFADDGEWEKAFRKFEKQIARYAAFRGKLSDDAATLAACLGFDADLDRLGERVGTYAFLKSAEDQGNSDYQRMVGRFQNASTRASEAASFIRPEILAVPPSKITRLLAAREIQPFRLLIERLLRYRPHTLGEREENLLAMQGEMATAAGRAFRQLLDADLKFGSVVNEKGKSVELSNSSFSQFLQSPQRDVRRNAFHQYYGQFVAHENTLAATLNGSIQKDVYYARARGYSSSLAAALFPDNVPSTVYDGLIAAVRKHLPAVHHYYQVRRRKMRLKTIHHYDTYVPILSDLTTRHRWNDAVNVVLASLAPLGSEYCGVLEGGLRGRWCDRYANQGKQSGAFSCGSFDGAPYILMNYKPEVLDDVFTLAHEAGHSMHSYYSARHQPFLYYSYTIFVAEVASTFNEQLLSHHLLMQAKDDQQRAFLINREIDGIRATIVRQTMFAEFEKISHAMCEAGEPLTVKSLRHIYRGLLQDYFGSEFTLDEELELECLRIPHFYRSFYVYKYATGLSAAIALSRRVLQGGPNELQDYLRFLQGGCSQDPLDLLRGAGVDMERPEPVETALLHFEQRIAELEQLLA
jgi:oligoendopeptidase F